MSLVDNTSKLREILDGVNSLPESGDSAKEEQEKSVDITENGTTEVIPDEGKVLSKVTVNVDVQSGGDNPLQYAVFRNGAQIFYGAVFPENYHLDFKIKGNNSSFSLAYFFSHSNTKEISLNIELVRPDGVDLSSSFLGCSKLTAIDFKNSPFVVNYLVNTFGDCTSLENINGVLDLSNTNNTANCFSKCYKLKEIRFVKNSIKTSLNFNDCTELSVESVQSIIDGLADLTGANAQTISFYKGADGSLKPSIRDNLTDAQISTITGKNWTLA